MELWTLNIVIACTLELAHMSGKEADVFNLQFPLVIGDRCSQTVNST